MLLRSADERTAAEQALREPGPLDHAGGHGDGVAGRVPSGDGDTRIFALGLAALFCLAPVSNKRLR
jgi:hypothetical protein